MIDLARFAADWEAGWNSRDLDRILLHYRHDVVFRSLKAVALTGSGEVCGIAALRRYWGAALERQPDLAFRVTETFGGHGMAILAYTNHRGARAAEWFEFDADGLVTRAAACHA